MTLNTGNQTFTSGLISSFILNRPFPFLPSHPTSGHHLTSSLSSHLTGHSYRLNTVLATNNVLKAKKRGFSFADVKCRLCARIGDKFHYFSDEEDFKGLLAKLTIDFEDVDSENGEPEAEEQQEEEVDSASEE